MCEVYKHALRYATLVSWSASFPFINGWISSKSDHIHPHIKRNVEPIVLLSCFSFSIEIQICYTVYRAHTPSCFRFCSRSVLLYYNYYLKNGPSGFIYLPTLSRYSSSFHSLANILRTNYHARYTTPECLIFMDAIELNVTLAAGFLLTVSLKIDTDDVYTARAFFKHIWPIVR